MRVDCDALLVALVEEKVRGRIDGAAIGSGHTYEVVGMVFARSDENMAV